MRVLGIDPSLTATGIATPGGRTFTILTKKTDGDRRLTYIHNTIYSEAIETADLAVVEDLPTNAKGAGITGMVQGVARLGLMRAGVPYVLVIASTLKKFATGNGGAQKADMRMELYKRTGFDIADDNQVDAWWLRQIGLHLTSDPGRLELPKVHLAALDKVKGWPT